MVQIVFPLETLLTIYAAGGFLAATILFLYVCRGVPLKLAAARMKKKPIILLASDAGTLDIIPIRKVREGWVEVGENQAYMVVRASKSKADVEQEIAAKRYILKGIGVPVLIAHNTRAVATDPGTLKLMFLDPEKIKEYVSEMNNPAHVLWMIRSAESAAKKEVGISGSMIAKLVLIFLIIMIIFYFAKSFLGM